MGPLRSSKDHPLRNYYLTLPLTNDTRVLYLPGTHGQLTYPFNARGEQPPRQANVPYPLA